MKLKTAFLAALAALPLLAGTAAAQGGYGYGYGYRPAPGYGHAPPPPRAHGWRAEQARRDWAWRRHEARMHRRYAPPPPPPHGMPGPRGPRW